MDDRIEPNSVPSSQPVEKPYFQIILIVIMAILCIGLVVALVKIGKQENVTTTTQPGSKPLPKGVKAIAKVGQETIYNLDYDKEASVFQLVEKKPSNIKQLVINKLANDSITLQAAKKAGFLPFLDSYFYDNPGKNYLARMRIIKQAKDKISSNSAQTSGTTIILWFANNSTKLNSQDADAFALKKITDLQNQVKSKKITIDQAAQNILTDDSLSQIDQHYAIDSVYTFDTSPKSFDPSFIETLWTLFPGTTSDVSAIYDKTDKKKKIAYQFGYIKDKKNASYKNFDEWFSQQKRNYEITIY